MKALSYLRSLCDMTMNQLAEKLGTTKQNISLWENGGRKIPEKYLPTLSSIFNVPENYFQKELSDIDKIDIQIFYLEKEIAESFVRVDDAIFDSDSQQWVAIEREYHDEGAEEHLRLLELDRKELQLIHKLKLSISNPKGHSLSDEFHDTEYFISSNETNIKIYNRLIDIVDSKIIGTKLLCEIIRAIELLDKQLAEKNVIWSEENPFDITTVSDQNPIVKDLFEVLSKYITEREIKHEKQRQESEEMQKLSENTDDADDLY